MRTAAVVLAAGRSSRMGRNKLLLKVAGRTILDRLLDAIEASTVEEIVVVLGYKPEEIKPIVNAHGALTILNIEHEKGMTSSFKTGLRTVKSDAAFLVLGDQLCFEPAIFDDMGRLMGSNPDALIVSPMYYGKRGHPVLFRRVLFREILDLGEDETVKDVVTRHELDHKYVEGSIWCTMDIDTPEDFDKAVRLFEATHAGS